MINGMPGNVSAAIAAKVLKNKRFILVPCSLTGPEIEENSFQLNGMTDGMEITLIKPDQRDSHIKDVKRDYPDFISVDFTHPSAVNDNADFYVKYNLPFIMGTTGGDRDLLEKSVLAGCVQAVIAPNMAKQIVGFQAMIEYAANTFPDLFEGYSLEIRESHQQGKADTSGTAKAMVTYYNKLGIPFSENKIIRERNPETQKNEWHIPEAYLSGHAWHTYTLTSPGNSAKFQFSHNINGRDIYAQGTLDAVLFLHNKLNHGKKEGKKGKIYTMIDVLKGKSD